MKRTASATWNGGLKDGKGSITTQTKTLSATPFSFLSRFESGSGTNPEELLAGAHAGCFSMALAFALQTAGMTPESVHTEATADLEQVDGGFAITKIHLSTLVKAKGKDAAKIKATAEEAKKNCPISKALASVPISLETKVEV
jgi:osmotically inducible protein OsmC